MLMVFADTLIETDLYFLADEAAEAVAWVKPVPTRAALAWRSANEMAGWTA